MRILNGERRQALLQALDEHLGGRVEIQGTNAGVHLVVWLDDVAPGDLDALVARAAERGVGIYPVSRYYTHPPDRAGLVLGYASMSTDEIRQGIGELALAMG